jgi:hypothetical protein
MSSADSRMLSAEFRLVMVAFIYFRSSLCSILFGACGMRVTVFTFFFAANGTGKFKAQLRYL